MFFAKPYVAFFSAIAVVEAQGSICDFLSTTPTATIQSGVIVGTTTSIPNATVPVNKFLGIPFAAAPTRSARFSVPKAIDPWTTPKDTKNFSSACIQVFNPLSARPFIEEVFNTPAPEESEDCLYLNVFAPRTEWNLSNPYRAVLYWMYGGGLRFGNAGQPLYDGSHFAALEDVIVVSVNYRTNFFGFPFSPAITNMTERNLGLLDQRAGLDWVQQNIKSFGGDPSKVTIFGQSAGGTSTDILLTSYPSNSTPPFHAAIMMSGTYSWLAVADCNNTNYSPWKNLTTNLGCNSTDATAAFECVKGKNASEIKYVQERYSVGLQQACDNITYVSDPRLRREAGNFARVPVISGACVDDGSYYAVKAGPNVTDYFATTFPNNTELRDKIVAAYTSGLNGTVNNITLLNQVVTDWTFHCPSVFLSNSSTKFVPTYRYLFNASFPSTRIDDPDRWPLEYQGAWHSSEIPIVFDTAKGNVTKEQRQLTNTMRGAWARFAKDPWSPPLEEWKTIGSQEQDVMSFGTDGSGAWGMVEDTVGKCEAWREYIEDTHL